MIFNSLEFLIFYPLVLLLFFATPFRFKWLLLLLASCYFYAAFIPVYILILFFTILVDYFAGILIDQSKGRARKIYLVLSVLANVGVLVVFKYYDFFIDNINYVRSLLSLSEAGELSYLGIILPLGLSFHTFQAMSYTIEVYKGRQSAEKHIGVYALYVMFYPQMVAGPIERPQNLLPQFKANKTFSWSNLLSGLRLMV